MIYLHSDFAIYFGIFQILDTPPPNPHYFSCREQHFFSGCTDELKSYLFEKLLVGVVT